MRLWRDSIACEELIILVDIYVSGLSIAGLPDKSTKIQLLNLFHNWLFTIAK